MVRKNDMFFFFKQKTAYEIGTGDWSSDVCSSDLILQLVHEREAALVIARGGHVGHHARPWIVHFT